MEDSLMHYGVLGMKWGVRKNPSKAGRKAIKKLRKYDSRAEGASNSAQAYRTVAADYRFKASTALDRSSRKENKKFAKKADKIVNAQLKSAAKYVKKGQKWASKMTKMSEVSKLDIDFAKSYGFLYNPS